MKKKRDIEGNRLHRFELSDKNRTVRWVLIAIFLAIAVVAVVVGMLGALQTPAGWQTVEASTTKLNCSDEFVLQYEYGAGDASPSAESKALEQLYGKLAENAWFLFCSEAGSSELHGIYELNQHINEEITVDAGLYKALERFVASGSRALYLAPVYAQYDRVFLSENPIIAEDCDPGQNPEQRDYVKALADFACDAEAIQLVLHGSNRVTLQVSENYLKFIKDNEIELLVDFGWLRNAFVADYIADALIESGFTNGYLASVDGFTRNLDRRNLSFSLNLFNKGDNGIDLAAVMDYTAPRTLVFLRSYPMYDLDARRYYSFEGGRTVTAMIDPADGMSKTAADNLVSYSETLTCAELALKMMPVFVADSFAEDVLTALTEQGIHSVYFSGKQIKYTQSDLKITISDKSYTK